MALHADDDDDDRDQDMEDEELGSADDEPQSTSEIQAPGRKRKATAKGAGSPGSMTSGCRYDSSLGMLTKKFLRLIDDAQDGVLDLNKASDTLQVQKRRIYDITNVLEGVGLIEKKSKNNIRWKGSSSGPEANQEADAARLKEDIAVLGEQERTLEEQIKVMGEAIKSMSDNPLNSDKLYVTDDDITSLPVFSADTIFAVKAPPGTTLEVPDPEEAASIPGQRRYRILLKSNTGQIDVFLVQHTNNVDTSNSQAADDAAGAAPAAAPEPQASAAGPAKAAAGELQGAMPPTVVKQEAGAARVALGGASPYAFPLGTGGTPYGNGVGASPSSNFNPFNSPFGPAYNTSPMVPTMNLAIAEDWFDKIDNAGANTGATLAQQYLEDEGPSMFADQLEWR